METEIINPVFMKALLRCYIFQKQARKKVFHNRRFFKQVLKVFRWQRRIKRQIKANNNSTGYPLKPSLLLQDSITLKISHPQISELGITSNKIEIDPYQTPISRPLINPNLRVLTKRETVTDLDIVRRNLWLMIVRKDVIQAQRRKAAFREQKLLKARMVAYRCQSHYEQFQKQHCKVKQQD